MHHSLAGIVLIERVGQSLSPDEKARLDDHFNTLLCKVRGFSDMNAARDALNELAEFQTDLATAHFKWKIPLSQRLRSFVRLYDRSDDPEIRSIVFNSIRKRHFCEPTEGSAS